MLAGGGQGRGVEPEDPLEGAEDVAAGRLPRARLDGVPAEADDPGDGKQGEEPFRQVQVVDVAQLLLKAAKNGAASS